MKKGSHASPEQRKRMKEAQLRASRLHTLRRTSWRACRLDPAWEARQRMANCVVLSRVWRKTAYAFRG
jgi:hypothetical protein